MVYVRLFQRLYAPLGDLSVALLGAQLGVVLLAVAAVVSETQ